MSADSVLKMGNRNTGRPKTWWKQAFCWRL